MRSVTALTGIAGVSTLLLMFLTSGNYGVMYWVHTYGLIACTAGVYVYFWDSDERFRAERLERKEAVIRKAALQAVTELLASRTTENDPPKVP
jgi:hypothetical protein